MPLTTGSRLGPYEITAAIGAGGMGEVYRARDSKLGRDVAIKVLPEVFASDAERMARFQREATVLASLNHPNIATIYGLEDSSSTRALVMELVEGPTLADRIKSGPIPINEALPIAKQICDALEYAHERGIIHRDLKPANVKVTNDDAVKVLDFGLAKALEGDPSSIDISTSPTISRMATMQGELLGTAAYMSPEQAKAKSVDRRADIWAFGCVIYEMLTGKQAFTGETVTESLAAVIMKDPDWSQLPSATPMRVRVLLQRCLQKDPKQRLRDIGDARISLDEVLSGTPDLAPVGKAEAAVVPLWHRALPWAIAATAVAVAAVAVWAPWRAATTPVQGESVRFQIPLPEKVTLATTGAFALSPDGRQLAFPATGSDGVQRVWVRALDSLEAHPLPGSESNLVPPFVWSPDSRYIAFDAGGKLKKIPVSGSPAETICDISTNIVGGSWNRDGVIIFGQATGGLMQVSAAGGSPASPLTILDLSRGETQHAMPSFLPDGRHFVYLRWGGVENDGVYVGSLDAKPEEQSTKRLVATQTGPAYVPSADSSPGQLLFLRAGTLLSQPFDARRLELVGEAATLADGLGRYLRFGFFSASTNGVLVYRASGAGSQQLTWDDTQGKALGTVGEPADVFPTLSLSPDGAHAAVSRIDAQGQNSIIWLLDFSRGTSTRFTFGSSSATSAVWSVDGNRIIFASNREGAYNLYQKLASGAGDEELLLKSDESKYPTSWSRDGRFLLYVVQGNGKAGIWVLPLEGDKKPFPFMRQESNQHLAQFSPDGHWVAYSSDESGREEIYVRPFSPDPKQNAASAGGKWLISSNGGIQPRWRGDGKELYYISSDRKLMAVEIRTSPVFQAGVPKVFFQTLLTSNTFYFRWDATADAKRFLLETPSAQSAQAPFTVVLNWQAALKK
jgi:Tol biopolymer transport system component